LQVAGHAGWEASLAALAEAGADNFFCAGVLALDSPGERLPVVLERLAKQVDAAPGVISALGWVGADKFDAVGAGLLASTRALHRKLGIAAFALHRKDLGGALADALVDGPDSVRIRALRAAGEAGRADLLPRLQAAFGDAKPEVAFWAARSALLLGDRDEAPGLLADIAMRPGVRQAQALRLVLQAMSAEDGHRMLIRLQGVPGAERLRIVGAGACGTPRYVPWLISQMENPAVARIAAEAFVNITGADFNAEQMEAMPPEGFDDGPTDDPDDENVELPEDIALPWPEVDRVKAWWAEHQAAFAPDTKYFLGDAPSVDRCLHHLKCGFQRQRVDAAQHLCLSAPGEVLFPTSAPAWRQRALLKAL
jgi:uncharacterized protein (TIGR02270 family)